jgi:phage repressor protein C with HTH and peptisase S24 domain
MANTWIKERLDEAGKRQADLARYLGVSESVLSKMIHTRKFLRAEEERKIHDFLRGATPPANDRYADMHATQDVRDPAVAVRVPLRAEMPEDVPVLGTAYGGATGGDFTMNGDSGLRVRRPTKLAGRDDIFALFVSGNSMEPRYPNGELIFLEKRRPPQINDHVVVEMQPSADGVQEAYLKKLLAITATKIKLEQYNPAKTIELDRAKVLQVIRVMTTHDLLGN